MSFYNIPKSLYQLKTEKFSVNKYSLEETCTQCSSFQGDWGLTEEMEEEERKRRVEFLKSVIPTTRAKLTILAQSYQVWSLQDELE